MAFSFFGKKKDKDDEAPPQPAAVMPVAAAPPVPVAPPHAPNVPVAKAPMPPPPARTAELGRPSIKPAVPVAKIPAPPPVNPATVKPQVVSGASGVVPPGSPAPVPAMVVPKPLGAGSGFQAKAPSGPSIPGSMPSPVAPRPAAPRPLPGGIPEPSQTILSPPKRQPSAAVNPAVPAAAAAPLPAPVEGEIAVPYSVLAKGLPPDVVNPGMESSDKTVNFPAQLIVDQLSLGKVSILLKDIAERAPDLLADPANIVDQPINLPLGDMFKLVSPSFLKRRPDQIIQKIEGDDIPTPFSEMAKKAAAAQASAASASGAAPAPAPAPAPAALKPAAPAPASMQSVTPVAPAPKPAVSGQQGGRPIIPPAPMTAPINPAARGPSPVPPAVRPVVPPAPATMALNKGTAVPSPSPNPGTAPIVRPSGFGGPSKPPIPPAPATTPISKKQTGPTVPAPSPNVLNKPFAGAPAPKSLVNLPQQAPAPLPTAMPAPAAPQQTAVPAAPPIVPQQVPVVAAAPQSELGQDLGLIQEMMGLAADAKPSIKEVAEFGSTLSGVDGCLIATEDGLLLAGTLPEAFNSQTISAFAPHLFKKVSRYIEPLQLGHARRFTIQVSDGKPMSFFRSKGLFVVFTHTSRKLTGSVIEKGMKLTEEVAKLYKS